MSQAFQDAMRELRVKLRTEAEKEGFAAVDEPCEFSDPNAPHPPKVFETSGFSCDGYGYLVNIRDNSASVNRCPCWLKSRTNRMALGYLSTLPAGLRLAVENASQEARWALGKALAMWNYGTPSLLLLGRPGCGKTIAGHAFVAGFCEKKGLSGLSIDCDLISNDARAMTLPDGDPGKVEAAARRHAQEAATRKPENFAILLDDIGRGRETQAVTDAVRGFIRNLYAHQGHCVVTTNLSEQDIGRQYGPDICRRLFHTPEWMTVVRC